MCCWALFEDINYSADEDLWRRTYPNRDFEYDPSDRVGKEIRTEQHSFLGTMKGEKTIFTIDYRPYSSIITHYAVLNVEQPGAVLEIQAL